MKKIKIHQYSNEMNTENLSSVHDSTFKFWPSKGNEPLTSVYNITPKLQTSTSGPSYFFPECVGKKGH